MNEIQIRSRLESSVLPAWEHLPDFGLYMDQLVTFVEHTLPEGAAGLTPAMINNYVKTGLIERPAGKKYTRESLAQLLMVCGLKQTTSVENMRRLLNAGNSEIPAMYDSFRRAQVQVAESFSAMPDQTALVYALRSASCQMICRMILDQAAGESPVKGEQV